MTKNERSGIPLTPTLSHGGERDQTAEEGAARSAVLITGASTGIGRACALLLDGMGYRVFAGVRKTADGEALRAASSNRLTPLILDVTDRVAVASAARTVTAAAGEEGLAGLINNAGISVPAPLEVIPLEAFRTVLDVNVLGLVAATQAFLPLVRKGRGRIINMGSMAGRMAFPFLGAYCASKFALRALTDALRMELQPTGVQVSLVEPGPIATPLWGKALSAMEVTASGLSPEGIRLYGGAFAAARRWLADAGDRGVPPERAAAVVVRALTAKRPKARYVVGRTSGLQVALARALPTPIVDWAIRREIERARRE